MRQLSNSVSAEVRNEALEMANYIVKILKGTSNGFTERKRQFYTWGAHNMMAIVSQDGSVGIEMSVSGLKHRGRVRIWYNYGTDLFDIEFLRARKEEAVKEISDIYLDNLQWICHSNIERSDDIRL